MKNQEKIMGGFEAKADNLILLELSCLGYKVSGRR
jgi:hypothetical protein